MSLIYLSRFCDINQYQIASNVTTIIKYKKFIPIYCPNYPIESGYKGEDWGSASKLGIWGYIEEILPLLMTFGLFYK